MVGIVQYRPGMGTRPSLVWVPTHPYFLCLYLTWYLLANTEQTHTLEHTSYYWDVNIEQEKIKEPRCADGNTWQSLLWFLVLWGHSDGVLSSDADTDDGGGDPQKLQICSQQLLISKLLEGFSVFIRQETSVKSDFISKSVYLLLHRFWSFTHFDHMPFTKVLLVWPPHTSSGAHPGCPRKTVLDTPLWCSIITSEPMFAN